MTRFREVADALVTVASTTKRTVKRDALADLLGSIDPDEIEPVVGVLVGELRQGRIGVGWAAIRGLDVEPATEPTLTVGDVDGAVDTLAATTGPGSQGARRAQLEALFARATAPEADLLGRLFVGEIRTGALAGVVTDAVAVAAGLPLAVVRRAVMLAGDLGAVARLALVDGRDAVEAVGLRPLRPVLPMLASTSESVADAITEVGRASVEWKLDGARIQVHRVGDDVRIYTRNLNDVTDRLPAVAALVRSFATTSVVLDGEILGFLGPDEAPRAFQDTMSRFSNESRPGEADDPGLVPFFFDLLHLDGRDLIDEPLTARRAALVDLAPGHVIPGTETEDPEVAAGVLREALDRGHEGVMVKAAASTYDAGRRGKAWRKVKPVHTLDLVVLAVEWGSGRRTGTLSNIHLGARDPERPDRFVMVGKTFKGMTDEMLAWQTERFQALRTDGPPGTGDGDGRDGHVVHVRPEQVVEIALDGVQTSTRYPGGVALRFARVVRYRHDKTAAEADDLTTVRALRPGR